MKQAILFSIQPAWKLLITDLGISPAEVLKRAELPADLFARRDAKLTPADYFRLWDGLEQAAGASLLPLRIGQHISVEGFDPPIFASLCSPNLNVAVQRLSRFKKLVGPLSLAIEISSSETVLTLASCGIDLPIPNGLAVAELVFLTQLARLGTRRQIALLRVELEQLPVERGPYLEFFGVPLLRGSANRLAFAAEDARQPFLTENAAMGDFFEGRLCKKLSDLQGDATITERVRAVLQEMLPAGQISVDEAALRLGLSKRSLQRRLAEESCSYQEALTATRQELANYYLARSSMSLIETAYLLGFEDGNSFIRAFRSWTGQTPGEYRASSLRQ